MKIDFRAPTALFGGSFDPVHDGHLAVIRAVKNALPGHQVVAVPAARSPGKQPPMASGEQRLRWLGLLGGREGFLAWDEEIRRGGDSFTVDTLERAHSLGAIRETLVLVLGADAYNSLCHWKEPARIRELCRIAVLERPGSPLQLENSEDLLLPMPPHSASSSAIRAGLRANPALVIGLPPEVKLELERLDESQNPYGRKN